MDIKDRKRPTLRTLSEVTGFAVTTVSRALRNESEINIKTRLTIQKAAEELGYRPDRAAQRLRGSSALTIGLIFDQNQMSSEFERRILAGAASVIYGETPHNVVVFPQRADLTPIEAVRFLVDYVQVDGLIFTNTTPQDERVRYLLDRNIHFVTYGRSDFQVPHPFVDFDNYEFARQAVERLAGRGRKRLALVQPAPNLTCTGQLTRGFFESAKASGIDARIVPDLFLHSEAKDFRSVTRELMSGANRPDGIVCGIELGAVAMLAGLRDAGLVVGRDLDLIAKSTSDLLDQIDPPIDSFFEDLTAAGETLARFLIEAFDDEPVGSLQAVASPVFCCRTDPSSAAA